LDAGSTPAASTIYNKRAMRIAEQQLRDVIRNVLAEGAVLKHAYINKYMMELTREEGKRHPFRVTVIKMRSPTGFIPWLTEPTEQDRSFSSETQALKFYNAMLRTFEEIDSREAMHRRRR